MCFDIKEIAINLFRTMTVTGRLFQGLLVLLQHAVTLYSGILSGWIEMLLLLVLLQNTNIISNGN